MNPVLRPDRLYFGDNGRIHCGSLRCAGMSAHFTGRTISGQRVVPVNFRDVVQRPKDLGPMRCETCDLRATFVADPDGFPATTRSGPAVHVEADPE